jgi:hypothetical protein
MLKLLAAYANISQKKIKCVLALSVLAIILWKLKKNGYLSSLAEKLLKSLVNNK